jgi:hypothetical protein
MPALMDKLGHKSRRKIGGNEMINMTDPKNQIETWFKALDEYQADNVQRRFAYAGIVRAFDQALIEIENVA